MSAKTRAPLCAECRKHPRRLIRIRNEKPFYATRCDPCIEKSIKNSKRFNALFWSRFGTLSVRTANTICRSELARKDDGFNLLLRADDRTLLDQRNLGPVALAEFRSVHPRPTDRLDGDDEPAFCSHPEFHGDARDIERMLVMCLEWLGNVRVQDLDRYLDAMPNNIPGIEVMEQHRLAIRAARNQQEDK